MNTNRYMIFALACLMAVSTTRADVPQDHPGAHQVKIEFAELGAGPMMLEGARSEAGFGLGTRKDEVVVNATLHLRFTYSPSLLPELSHLRVILNGQVLAAVTLPKADAGREVEREIALDPRYFSDYNQLRFGLIGHYSLDCEDPQHSSLWANISPRSDLTLTLLPVELRNDLALLPAPFFDQRDNRPLDLPIVLPPNASRGIIRSAGLAASWFGALADYRGARFPLNGDGLPSRHALVFATNQSLPERLDLSPVEEPTVRIIDLPSDPRVKLLVFQGQDEEQLRQAVEGLVLGSAVTTGDRATFSRVLHERRRAYDAPRWLRSDRPVKLGELVDSNDQLERAGIAPAPINLDMRLPPDLFTWNHAGVPIDLHYRYTAPAQTGDNSFLTVSVNDQLLRSYRLTPEAGGDGRMAVPLLQSDDSRRNKDLVIPAFKLASNNQIQFRFEMEGHREGMCSKGWSDYSREAIDPDSTLDISGIPHYAAMPNLTLFANAGYPFTRYADLAETAVVLPDDADRSGIEQLFSVLGRMGRDTGVAALGYQLLDTREALTARDVDLLVLGGAGSNALVSHWRPELPLELDAAERDYRQNLPATHTTLYWPHEDRSGAWTRAEVGVHAAGALGAILSFESPVSRGRTVVALLGSDEAGVDSVTSILRDDGKVALIRGGLALVRGDGVQSFQASDVYYVGSLSFWQRLWFQLAQHALTFTLLSLGTAITAGLLIYGWLQKRAARRLDLRAAD